MKKISNFFTKDKDGRITPSTSAAPLSSTEELQAKSGVEEENSKKHHESKSKGKINRDASSKKSVIAKPKECTTCKSPYRFCICNRCFLCNTMVVSYKGLRHCPRCWRSVCSDCATSVERGTDDSFDEDSSPEQQLCECCAAYDSLRLLFREKSFSTFLLNSTVNSRDATGEEKEAERKGETLGREPCHFSWGLYALLSVAAPPRICVHPSCARPFSFRTECSHCHLPTLSCTILSDAERFRTGTEVEESSPRHAKPMDFSSLISYDQRYRDERNKCIAGMKTEDAEDYAALAFPRLFGFPRREAFPSSGRSPLLVEPNIAEASGMLHSFTIPPSSSSTSITMMALLSSVAVQVAEVPPFLAGSRLFTCGYPLAPLLGLRASERTHCVLDYPGGGVSYIPFRTGEYRGIYDRMQSGMVEREVWRKKRVTNSVEESTMDERAENSLSELMNGSIGFFPRRNDKEKEGVDAGKLFSVFSLRNLFEELDSPEMNILRKDLVAMRKAGVHLVLCGHGIGGAMASLMALQLIIEYTELMCPKEGEKGIHCITFGAPALIGGMDCIHLLEDMNFTSCFHHFVYRSDLVPRFHLLEAYLDGDTVTEKLGCPISEKTKGGLQKAFWDWMNTQQPILKSGDLNSKLSSGIPAEHKHEKKKKEASSSQQENKLSKIDAGDSPMLVEAFVADKKHWGCNGDVFSGLRDPFGTSFSDSPKCAEGTESLRNTSMKVDMNEKKKYPLPFMSSFTALFSPSDPVLFGCYHCFSLEPKKMYQFCHSKNDPIRELLGSRQSLRVLFGDHLIAQYGRAILEYINSCNVVA